jgi:hypothetical protein
LASIVVAPSRAAELVQPLSPSALVGGKRVDAYPALWWQWVNRKRWGAQAFQDPTGAQCALNQRGPVWFLAGTDGTEKARRHCWIPEGKHIFLPVITMLATSRPGATLSCQQVKAQAAANNEHAVATEISLDGVRFQLSRLRMRSECFNAFEFADHIRQREYYTPSATDGYWLMLPPLSKGVHVLHIDAHYTNRGAELGELEQQFEYKLQVGGRKLPEFEDDDKDSAEWLGT